MPLLVVNRGGAEPELDFALGESAVAAAGRRLHTFTAAQGGIFYVDWNRRQRFRQVQPATVEPSPPYSTSR